MEEILFVEIHRLLLIAVAPSPRLIGPFQVCWSAIYHVTSGGNYRKELFEGCECRGISTINAGKADSTTSPASSFSRI
jgi:hypothetical protein